MSARRAARPRLPRAWVGRLLVAAVAAAVVDVALTGLEVEHDARLVALLTLTTVAVGVLALGALETPARVDWFARRTDARATSGEDTRTETFRHLVEIHRISRDADDAVLWQVADVAARRLRQVHGLRYADDPERATALLGPALAELVSHDRRHRYRTGVRRRRLDLSELGELVRRIEDL